MKKSLFLATFVASLLTFNVTLPDARAQDVRIIDLSEVFKKHNGFNAVTTRMRADAEQAQAALKAREEALKKMALRLKDFQEGSPDFRQLREEITTKTAELQADAKNTQNEFLEREATIYFNVYKEILDEVKYYAEQNGVHLVLRFNGNEADPNNPEESLNPQKILQTLNKSVFYHSDRIDITLDIINSLNERRPEQAEGRPGVPRPNRPRNQ